MAARGAKAAAERRRQVAAAPWRVTGHGVGGGAALLVALRLADRFRRGGGVAVASVVTFGAPRVLGGESARRAGRRLEGSLLHVSQGDDLRACGPPEASMAPRQDPLSFLFPDPLRHPGPTLVLPSSVARRRLTPAAAAAPQHAKAWLLRSGTAASVPGGERAISDAWGSPAARKPMLADDFQAKEALPSPILFFSLGNRSPDSTRCEPPPWLFSKTSPKGW